jgi:hypothetical protein
MFTSKQELIDATLSKGSKTDRRSGRLKEQVGANIRGRDSAPSRAGPPFLYEFLEFLVDFATIRTEHWIESLLVLVFVDVCHELGLS